MLDNELNNFAFTQIALDILIQISLNNSSVQRNDKECTKRDLFNVLTCFHACLTKMFESDDETM